MNCPSCGAGNSDEAECCTLCFARFKAAPPKPAPPAEVLLPDVRAERDGWVYHGFLLLHPEGLYFFVSDERYEGGLIRRSLALGLGQVGGLIGNVVVDSVVESGASHAKRPAWPVLKHRQDFADATHAALSNEPAVLACARAFFVPKADVVAIWSAPDGADVDAAGGRLSLHGGGDWAAFKAAAETARFTVLKAEPRRSRAAYWVAAIVAIGGTIFAFDDVREAAQLNAKAARYDGVRGIVVTERGPRFIMPDGTERNAKDVPWSERLPWYRYGLIFAFLCGMGWLMSQLRGLRRY
ncbi:MAG: hypothetical protein HY553_04295 [Elusimicrobia bacterium]|nr:hypothetical protein [Elusimicrobiota bacterium]